MITLYDPCIIQFSSLHHEEIANKISSETVYTFTIFLNSILISIYRVSTVVPLDTCSLITLTCTLFNSSYYIIRFPFACYRFHVSLRSGLCSFLSADISIPLKYSPRGEAGENGTFNTINSHTAIS